MVGMKTFGACRSPLRAACTLASIGLGMFAQVVLCHAEPLADGSNTVQSNRAGPPVEQSRYVSPDAAAQALFQAVQSGTEQAVHAVLGPDDQLATSGDAELDKLDREQFVEKYQQMHRVARQVD